VQPVPRRFLITYAAAFGLLYGLGFFITGRHIDAHWASLPFDPHRKITPPHDFVFVYLMRADDGENIELVTRTMWQFHDDEERYPDLYGTQNYLGTISINQSWQSQVLAPLIWRTDSVLRASVDIEPNVVIPSPVIEDAKSLTYREARITLDAPHFYESELDFWIRDPSAGSGEWLYLSGTTETFISFWLIPILFTTIPLAAAWWVSAVTCRDQNGESCRSDLEEEGSREAEG